MHLNIQAVVEFGLHDELNYELTPGPSRKRNASVPTNYDSVKSGGFWWIFDFWAIKRTMRCGPLRGPSGTDGKALLLLLLPLLLLYNYQDPKFK